MDEQRDQCISGRAHNIPRAAGVGGKHLYQIDKQTISQIPASSCLILVYKRKEHLSISCKLLVP